MAKKNKRSRLLIGGLVAGVVGVGLVGLCCTGIGIYFWSFTRPTKFPHQKENYAAARQGFQTRLIRKGPAPQKWAPLAPPRGVREIGYRSGDLTLKAWVNEPRSDGS